MIDKVRVAVVGVGNNTSALVQGIAFYRETGSEVGLSRPQVAGLGVGDVDVVTAFALSADKVGRDLHEAIFQPPNNFPRLGASLPPAGVTVQRGLVDMAEVPRVASALDGAEVVLYSAPSGRTGTARAYAAAALEAGAAFINTTSDPIARDPEMLRRFEEAGRCSATIWPASSGRRWCTAGCCSCSRNGGSRWSARTRSIWAGPRTSATWPRIRTPRSSRS